MGGTRVVDDEFRIEYGVHCEVEEALVMQWDYIL
jgi:hypothetical protein